MNLASVNLNQLVGLEALLRERHVGRAAQRMGVTQSAMSHTLRSLRELTGDPLLVRVGNHMVLTPFAEDALERLRRGLGELEAVVSGRAAFDPATIEDTFTLAAPDGVAAIIAGTLHAELGRRAPAARLRIQPVELDELLLRLGDGAVDAALIPPLFSDGPLQQKVLGTASVSVVCRRDHPVIHKRLSLAQYCKVPHAALSLTGDGPSYIDEILAERDLSRDIRFRVPYLVAFIEVIAGSDLVGTVPDGLAEFYCEGWPVKSFPFPLGVELAPLVLCWHPRLDDDAANAFFREVIEQAAKLASRTGDPRLASKVTRGR